MDTHAMSHVRNKTFYVKVNQFTRNQAFMTELTVIKVDIQQSDML